MNERYGKRLLDTVEKETSAGEARGPFHVYCSGQSTQSRIHEFAFEAQFYSAPCAIRGGHQRLVRNGHGYMCHITRADPLLQLRRTQSHQASIEGDAPEGRTSLDELGTGLSFSRMKKISDVNRCATTWGLPSKADLGANWHARVPFQFTQSG